MSSKSLYIASSESKAGSLIVSIGIAELLKSRINRLAFFRPIITDLSVPDNDINFILEYFNLNQPYELCYGIERMEAETLLSEGDEKAVLERLLERYYALESQYDFVLIQGLDPSSFFPGLSHDFNHIIANNLQAPYISVINGKNKSFEHLCNEIHLEKVGLKNHCVQHIAVFVNRLDRINYDTLKHRYEDQLIPTYFMQEIEELNRLSIGEVKDSLECRQLFGGQKELDRLIQRPKILAMNVEHILTRIEDGDLIIVPGDRLDIIMTVLYANYAKNFPSVAGVILTGALEPGEPFLELIRGIETLSVPILCIDSDTYNTALLVDSISPTLRPKQNRKIALAIGEFINSIKDAEILLERLRTVHSDIVTPSMFEYSLFQRARKIRKRIVLPESGDERILRAAEILLRRDVVDLILLGEPDKILHQSSTLGIDISKASIIDPNRSPFLQQYIDEFYEMRRHKGLTMNKAVDAMNNISYFATMMVYNGDADGMVSGATHTTQETILPALQILKTIPGISLVSSLFFMCMETKVLVYSDCAVNQDPTASELAEIAIASAQSATFFGIEPRIAMLSYSTGSSGKGDDVEKVRLATQIVKERYPEILIEGPIQYDAAIDPDVARIKLPDSEVAGKATIFIFPDLNTGNNTYKAVQRSSDAVAIGPILQGLRKPVNDLSRGCEIPDIVNTILITAIQAQGEHE